MYILSPQQISQVDTATIKINNSTSVDLMEHAASLCFNWLHERLQGEPVKIHVFCGIGNNGGDGLVMARHLFQHGYNVTSYVVNFSDKRSDEFLINYDRLKELGEWPVVINGENDFPKVEEEDLVIDAIFGNGLTRKPNGFTKKLIQTINSIGVYILAIDAPSGLFSNDPVSDRDSVLNADHILTFEAPKLSFLLPENDPHVATWDVIDIGLDQNVIKGLQPKMQYITKDEITVIYKPRNKWSHKGSFGHSLILGGSYGKIGAVSLATSAALKIGSGRVTAYLPKCGYNILQIAVPEAMVEVDDEKVLHYYNIKTQASVIGLGPGMGTSEKTSQGFEKFLSDNQLPLVIDADGINLLSKNPSLLNKLPSDTILTPHPKELERLIGHWENDYAKLEKAVQFSTTHRLILVIKGAHTAVVAGDKIHFNSTGNPALATAGSGDVLTGLITGLMAQNYRPVEAAILGVYLHGSTADLAVSNTAHETFNATILEYLNAAILEIVNHGAESESTPGEIDQE
jgi:hydroxyethylthiazole kinase-like uncharacterized protein yjeF